MTHTSHATWRPPSPRTSGGCWPTPGSTPASAGSDGRRLRARRAVRAGPPLRRGAVGARPGAHHPRDRPPLRDGARAALRTAALGGGVPRPLDDRGSRIPFLSAPVADGDGEIAQAPVRPGARRRAAHRSGLGPAHRDSRRAATSGSSAASTGRASIRRLRSRSRSTSGSSSRCATSPCCAWPPTRAARRRSRRWPAATLDDPSTQVYSDIVGLLQHSADPDGTALLIDYLEHPTAESGLWVCLFTRPRRYAWAGSPRRRPSRSRRSRWACCATRPSSVRIHREAANLLRRIDPPTRSRIINALSAESRKRIAHIVAQGSAVADHEVDALTRSLEIRLRQTMCMTRWAADPRPARPHGGDHHPRRGARPRPGRADADASGAAVAAAYAHPAVRGVGSTTSRRSSTTPSARCPGWSSRDQADELVELAFQAAHRPHHHADRRRSRRQRPGHPPDRRPHHEPHQRARRRPAAQDARRPEEPGPRTRIPARHVGPDSRLADLAGRRPLHGASPEWLTSFRWWLDLPAWARPHPLPRLSQGRPSSCARLVAGRPVSDSMSPLTGSSSPARIAV